MVRLEDEIEGTSTFNCMEEKDTAEIEMLRAGEDMKREIRLYRIEREKKQRGGGKEGEGKRKGGIIQILCVTLDRRRV